MQKRKVLNDVLLVAGLLLAVLIIFVIFKLNLKDGNCVKVSINSDVKNCYTLSKDTTVEIRDGANTNTLVIEDNKAYIIHANCPDKICVAHKPISKTGETIVCLPHKLVVEIAEE